MLPDGDAPGAAQACVGADVGMVSYLDIAVIMGADVYAAVEYDRRAARCGFDCRS